MWIGLSFENNHYNKIRKKRNSLNLAWSDVIKLFDDSHRRVIVADPIQELSLSQSQIARFIHRQSSLDPAFSLFRKRITWRRRALCLIGAVVRSAVVVSGLNLFFFSFLGGGGFVWHRLLVTSISNVKREKPKTEEINSWPSKCVDISAIQLRNFFSNMLILYKFLSILLIRDTHVSQGRLWFFAQRLLIKNDLMTRTSNTNDMQLNR